MGMWGQYGGGGSIEVHGVEGVILLTFRRNLEVYGTTVFGAPEQGLLAKPYFNVCCGCLSLCFTCISPVLISVNLKGGGGLSGTSWCASCQHSGRKSLK